MIHVRTKKHYTLLQFCNDWINAETDDGLPKILNPLMVKLDDDAESQDFKDDGGHGFFWRTYELIDLRFVKIL